MDFYEIIERTARTSRRTKDEELERNVTELAAALHRLSANGVSSIESWVRRTADEMASRIDRVNLAATGLGWLGSGVSSVEDEIRRIVVGANREITISIYSLTSGWFELLELVKNAASVGVVCRMIINDFERQSALIRTSLLRLQAESGRIKLFTFAPGGSSDHLHAKVVCVDRNTALIGSANFSFQGMVSGHELALVVRGPSAELIASRLDMLIGSSRVKPILDSTKGL